MGKKAKSQKAINRAAARKVDPSTLPAPPPPVSEEIGSLKLLDKPNLPGSVYKALDADGYDDGGVADLTLVIDLEDVVLRRKRGENSYFEAIKKNLLPRMTQGVLAKDNRRDQKIKLAQILFSEEEAEGAEEETNASEVYNERTIDIKLDDETLKKRLHRLKQAKFALNLSSVLKEPACASLSLSEMSKRYLGLGKDQADAALRCAEKAIEICTDGFFDSDIIAMEAAEEIKIDPKYEKNATSYGLTHPETLKLQSSRVSQLCLRSAYLHRGNALAALGRNKEARESYEKVLPLLEAEHRTGRVDWERTSIYVNIGNTYSREGDYAKASEQYDIAEQLGNDHYKSETGAKPDGLGMMVIAMRNRAFALQRAGKDDEAKKRLREVLELQPKLQEERVQEKELHKKIAEEQAKQQQAAQLEAANKENQ